MFFKDIDPYVEYDPEELKLGIETEREHTNYKVIATIIAKQHLAEDAEDIHKPVRPGILKRAAGGGKLTCSKAKQVKSKQKNKGNNTAKAAQRFCNYRGCKC